MPAASVSKTSRTASAKAISASDEDADELMAFDSGKTLRDLENEAIVSALRRNGGNMKQMACFHRKASHLLRL